MHPHMDITLLGIPGNAFAQAHRSYRKAYGEKSYESTKAWAQQRHREWTEKGFKLWFAYNWRGSLYVRATPPAGK